MFSPDLYHGNMLDPTGGYLQGNSVAIDSADYTDYNITNAFGIGGLNSSGTVTISEGTLMGDWAGPWFLYGGTDYIQRGLWDKIYDYSSQNLLGEVHRTYDYLLRHDVSFTGQFGMQGQDLTGYRNLGVRNNMFVVETDTSYNVMGSPLSSTLTESAGHTTSGGATTTTRTATTAYAYWGASKYFQQKAVLDPAGRYSYTDYYDNTASAGSKGMTHYVYDPKHAGFYLDTTITPPSGTPTGNYWKYQLKPSDPTAYSGKTQYDSKGRVTDTWKLQTTPTISTPSTWTYVQSHMTYGADTDGSWGQAANVVEDYGGINRTTQNLHYTSWGKADQVLDAAGHQFNTTYDLDGVIQEVDQVVSGSATPVATYTYGTTAPIGGAIDVTYGQVLSVVDGLSGVSQSMSYVTSGVAIGQPASVAETDSTSVGYTTSYTYNSYGDRKTATYATNNGTVSWGYSDYLPVGADLAQASRVPQTVTKLDGSGNPTAEAFHYSYGTSGQLLEAAFAQTPKSGFTPTTGSPWYDVDHQADVRARAHYVYDPAGRTTSVEHYWDTMGTGGYTSQSILANACGYEIGTGLNRGLKTSNSYYTAGTGTGWTLNRTETYGYDSSLDYLTSADYSDGLSGATPTWTYDAAGNRASDSTNTGTWTYDNLNRMSASPMGSYSNDILGNRTAAPGSVSMTWDSLNRMTSFTNSTATTNYGYRADGLRYMKASPTVTSWTAYDGQMPMQEVDVTSGGTAVTNNGLGARGLDYEQRTNSSGTVTIFQSTTLMAT